MVLKLDLAWKGFHTLTSIRAALLWSRPSGSASCYPARLVSSCRLFACQARGEMVSGDEVGSPRWRKGGRFGISPLICVHRGGMWGNDVYAHGRRGMALTFALPGCHLVVALSPKESKYIPFSFMSEFKRVCCMLQNLFWRLEQTKIICC